MPEENIAIFEGKRATEYDQFVETWIPQYDFLVHSLPRIITNNTTTGKKLLIAGCGSGNEILAFKEQIPDCQITGVDPSPEMLFSAREKLSQFSGVEFVEGYVNELAPEIKYDAATLILVMHFLKDDGEKLNVLKSVSERLQVGAPFVLVDIFGAADELKNNLDILKCFLPHDLEPDSIEERLNRIQNSIQYIPEERLFNLLEESGFNSPLRFFQSSIYGGWIAYKK